MSLRFAFAGTGGLARRRPGAFGDPSFPADHPDQNYFGACRVRRRRLQNVPILSSREAGLSDITCTQTAPIGKHSRGAEADEMYLLATLP